MGDEAPQVPPGAHYDPSCISETYNIYTGSSAEAKTQRKSEDATLALQKAQAEEKFKLMAKDAVTSTSAFSTSQCRMTRSRTAVAAPSGMGKGNLEMEGGGSFAIRRAGAEAGLCSKSCA